jgi:hypothetical protein
MFLLEYDSQGELEKITPNAPFGLIGAYVDKLPIPIDEMLELGIVEEVIEQDKIYYKIKGEI